MLLQLDIHNIALIEEISVELSEGLNILTGETGAGKSIIIDSIGAILGERLSRELIRTGKEKAFVEAIFKCKDDRLNDIFESLGIEAEADGTLVLSREFSVTGKNVCRVNGRIVTASVLKDIGQRLIDIHGQHDNQSLLKTESHIEFLDSFGGEKTASLLEAYSALLSEYREVSGKIKKLTRDAGEREKRLDLLKFQVEEIKSARLKPGEEEELQAQKNILANAEKIAGALAASYDELYMSNEGNFSVFDGINRALLELKSIAHIEERYGELLKRLEDIVYRLEDLIGDIRRERDSVEFNPDLLDKIEERLDLIQRLKRKYGFSIEQVLNYLKSAEEELGEVETSEEALNELQEKLKAIDARLFELCLKLHEERKRTAQTLEEMVARELEDLEMPKVKFKVSVELDGQKGPSGEYGYNRRGLDRVEFLISPNPGEPLKPLSKIASGGEMSRIMLAIKVILAGVDKIPTLIFDEIDMGISGKTAYRVGEKLALVSGKHQVICVTHLAQIACMADRHFLIQKAEKGHRTETSVYTLSEEDRKKEIARMLGGTKITDITLKHAEEMLETAKSLKS